MSSDIEICNSALVRLGAHTIESFSDDTVESNVCDQIYERVRNAILVAHPWNFAVKRVTLSKLSSDPAWGYDNEFNLPSDCLRVLGTRYDSTIYKIEGRKIVSNVETIDLLYIFKETLTGNYSPNFREVLEKKLALELGYHLVQNSQQQQLLRDEYLLALADARSFDSQEGFPDSVVTDTFLDSRINGADFGEI